LTHAPRPRHPLFKAFAEDWDGAAPARPPGAVPTGSAGAGGPAPDGEAKEAPDVVRPGRLLSTLHAMRQELQAQQNAGAGSGASTSAAAAAAGGEGAPAYGPLLQRLNQIQIEAALVLDEMQRGKARGGGAAGASESGAPAAAGGGGGGVAASGGDAAAA
jgi:hypothetical protein